MSEAKAVERLERELRSIAVPQVRISRPSGCSVLGTDLLIPQALGEQEDDWDPDPHSLLEEDDIVD